MPTSSFIRQVAEHLGSDAWRAERIARLVFRELHDRLPEADAAHVVRHLPIALRPLWLVHAHQPEATEYVYRREFLADVMEGGAFPTSMEAERAVVAVFAVLRRRLDRVRCNTQALSRIFGQLPHDLAVLWRAAEMRGTGAPRRRPACPLIVEHHSHITPQSSAA